MQTCKVINNLKANKHNLHLHKMRYKESETVHLRRGRWDLSEVWLEENGARESLFERHILISALFSSPIYMPF